MKRSTRSVLSLIFSAPQILFTTSSYFIYSYALCIVYINLNKQTLLSVTFPLVAQTPQLHARLFFDFIIFSPLYADVKHYTKHTPVRN